jgi:hypothetical protein
MFAKPLALFLCCAFAIAAPFSTTEQPQLVQLVQPYAQQLRAVGVMRVTSLGARDMVRLETQSGPVYVPYPAGAPDVAFILEVGPSGVQASAETFVRDQDEKLLAALMPEVFKVTAANNRLEWLRANPWH